MATVAQFIELTNVFGLKHGFDFRDAETGRRYCPEEAVCREMYGPHWWDSAEFHRDNAMVGDQIPNTAITTILAMTEQLPAWMTPISSRRTA